MACYNGSESLENGLKNSLDLGRPSAKKSGLIVCFGEMLIDFVPTVGAVSLAEAPAFHKAPGGAPANVAVGISRLGGRSAFIGKVGDDEFGHMLAGILRENNVMDQGIRFDSKARTALAFVTLKVDGEREFMFYRNPSADMLLLESELDKDLIRKASIFHYGSISLISALEFRSTFTTTRKGNNNCKGGNGGRNRSGRRKRASDHCSKSPSPRVLKKARGSNIAIDDQRSTHIIDGPTIPADGPTILYNFQGSFIAEKSIFEKPELEAMERTAANGSEGSVLNKSYGGFEGVNKKAAMKSIGEVVIENPATQMVETQFGFGSANYFVFPIVSEIQQEEETNLVTLPLLPETPSLQKDLVLGSSASNSTSIDHKPNTRNASCDKEVIPLRLFGKDLSHKEVAASHLSSNESPKRRNFVPIVGLSFL